MKFLHIFLLLFTTLGSNSTEFLPLPANHLVRHTYYTLSYNDKYKEANWVYYTLTDSMVLNSGEERSHTFKMDKWVATESAKSSDYTKSGYDRGHLCPAGDMGFNHQAMEESFLMSNISPQAPDFNRGIWKELETKVREWALKEHKLYVVTGPIFKNDKGTIGKDKVEVPGYFFKIIYDPTDEPKLIAFVLPNEKSDHPLTDFVITTDETEKLTGFDFFSQLPDDLENKLESRIQLGGWFVGFAQETAPEIVTTSKTHHSEIYFYIILVFIILLVAVFVYIWSRRKKQHF